MRVINSIEDTSDYLKDESQLRGKADKLYFVHSTSDVEYVLNKCYSEETPITIQGALTGISGGAVPLDGDIINTSEMTNILGMSYYENSHKFSLIVEAGITLKEINQIVKSKKIDTSSWSEKSKTVYEKFIKSKPMIFPNDPTETLASIGGMVACDSSGACSFRYGSIRNYVQSLTLVTPKKTLKISRNQYKYSELKEVFSYSKPLPELRIKNDDLKDVAGLYYQDDMDLIDLIIGDEGIFGVITEVEILLIEEPKIKAGIMMFLNQRNGLSEFVNYLKSNKNLVAIEYMDENSLNILRQFRDSNPSIKKLPVLLPEFKGAIYLEYHMENEEEFNQNLLNLYDDLDKFNINDKHQWMGIDVSDYDKLKEFRHALPECINLLISIQKQQDKRIHKVATDMSVPKGLLEDILNMYYTDMDDLELNGLLFGHIGDNHLHVNIIPKTSHEQLIAQNLIKKWAYVVSQKAGSITAEHGTGKLKKELLSIMIGKANMQKIRTVKEIFEPKKLINQGTMID